jgi:hypothetical protein
MMQHTAYVAAHATAAPNSQHEQALRVADAARAAEAPAVFIILLACTQQVHSLQKTLLHPSAAQLSLLTGLGFPA